MMAETNRKITPPSLHTTLHTTLENLGSTPAGFSASEVTGYGPEQVRRAAEALVVAKRLHRAQVSARRVRYFSTIKRLQDFLARKPAALPQRLAVSQRAKAGWSTDEPGLITAQTKITRAPAPPSGVYRTNTYLQF
ncbi:MAG: hypothetical protein ABIX12_11485 [Rubrivivax sp.]